MTDLQHPPKVIDWDLIQARYIQGVGPTELSKMFGVKSDTISVRATRKGWQRLKQKPSTQCQTVTISTERSEAESPKLTVQSERTRRALADVLTRSAEELASAPIRNVKHALAVNQEAESMVRNAKVVFGWCEGQTNPAVRIQVLGSLHVLPNEQTPFIEQTPVIDVATVPEST